MFALPADMKNIQPSFVASLSVMVDFQRNQLLKSPIESWLIHLAVQCLKNKDFKYDVRRWWMIDRICLYSFNWLPSEWDCGFLSMILIFLYRAGEHCTVHNKGAESQNLQIKVTFHFK